MVKSLLPRLRAAAGSPPARRAAKPKGAQSGFTLLEAQIALLLLILGLGGILLQAAYQRRHLAWIQDYGKVHGVVEVAASRVVMAVSEVDPGDPLPRCGVTLLGVTTVGGGLTATAEVTRHTTP